MPSMNRHPSVDHLHRVAKRRLPKFSYDYVDGGTGPEVGRNRNRDAIEAINMVCKYVTDWSEAEIETEVFGRKYSMPFGISPMGLASLQWPKAELHFARAGKAANMPVTLSTACTVEIEEFAKEAGDCGWFQLYPPKSEEINDDLLKRAADSGITSLFVTVDVPARGWRPRDMYNGLAVPPKLSAATIWNAAIRPHWSLAQVTSGLPHFKTLGRYSKDKSMRGMADFVGEQLGQTVSKDRLKRIRDRWDGNLIIKGVMHTSDAEAAIDMGYNGILVSNHGGRQLDAMPSTIEVLPEIVRAVGDRATVMIDSGFSNGLDIVKAYALGAKFVFCGRAFMWGLAGLGPKGPSHVADLLEDEVKTSLIQLGCPKLSDLDDTWLWEPETGNRPPFRRPERTY